MSKLSVFERAKHFSCQRSTRCPISENVRESSTQVSTTYALAELILTALLYALGVKISENDLIAGVHETTRGLGNHGDKDIKACVTPMPYCWTYEVDSTLECIIVATEGLWEVLRYDIVVDIVTQVIGSHPISDAARARTALQSATEKSTISGSYTTDEDDIAVCINEILSLVEDDRLTDEDLNERRDAALLHHRAAQCNEEEIRRDIWNSLSEQQRHRLELSERIAEQLVAAALLAQSKTNISVICLLLPGVAV